jgi:hypothetical protein
MRVQTAYKPEGMAGMFDFPYDWREPYRWRTNLRGKIPWFLVDLGLFGRGPNCEAVGR